MSKVMNVSNLQKSYGSHQVLKGISFHVNKGETFALLGVNGAGKTTTLECLQGLRAYQNGTVEIQGTTGVQLQSATLPGEMKVKEAIQLFAKWQKCEIDKRLWESFQMEPIANQRYHTLSTGQKRRVHLMLALLHDPDILFLDEPTAGLDVESRVQLHEEIRKIQKQGKTIILASHDMQEVEELCDHIVIMKDGGIAYDGDVKQLNMTKKALMIRLQVAQVQNLPTFEHAVIQSYEQGWYTFSCNDVVQGTYELLSYFKEQQLQPSDMQLRGDTLESLFLDIAKEDSK